MNVHPMWDEYPALRNELAETIQLIEKQITIRHPDVQQKIKELLTGGGKLLRPAYSILFSQFAKERDPKKAQAVAAAIEVLHLATLVHDDVVDEAATRRGQDTFNAAYGNRIAIYTGDYLFTVCFNLLQEYVADASILQLDSNGMETILLGELNQMTNKYQTNMRMRDYFRQVKGKTAELFALSCYSGAYQATENKKLAQQAYRIGQNIGVAFQLIDDNLDYNENSEKIGKPVLQDLRNGIYTAPLLYALQTNRDELLPYLLKKDQITDEEALRVLALVKEARGIEEAQRLAAKYTQKALKQIQQLPDEMPRNLLSNITEQILQRES